MDGPNAFSSYNGSIGGQSGGLRLDNGFPSDRMVLDGMDTFYNPWNQRTILEDESTKPDCASSPFSRQNSFQLMSPCTANMDKLVSQIVDEPRSCEMKDDPKSSETKDDSRSSETKFVKSLFNVNAKPFEQRNSYEVDSSLKQSSYFDTAVELCSMSRNQAEIEVTKPGNIWSAFSDDENCESNRNVYSAQQLGSKSMMTRNYDGHNLQQRILLQQQQQQQMRRQSQYCNGSQFDMFGGGDYARPQHEQNYQNLMMAAQNLGGRKLVMKPSYMEPMTPLNLNHMQQQQSNNYVHRTPGHRFLPNPRSMNQGLISHTLLPPTLRKPMQRMNPGPMSCGPQAAMYNDAMQPTARCIRGANANKLHESDSLPSITDLNKHLERGCNQLKLMEKDRKKFESELVRLFPGKKISSINNIPLNRLPTDPTRMDKLLLEMSREHARVFTLIGKMEQLRDNKEMDVEIQEHVHAWLAAVRTLQHKRTDEILTRKMGLSSGDHHFDEDLAGEILLAVRELCTRTRAARTALWAAFISLMEL